MQSAKVLIVIPARYASTRLPGKPLERIAGKEMILRVALIAQSVVSKRKDSTYVVATDDSRISDFCQSNSIPVVMASEQCNSGTERAYNVAKNLPTRPELVINLQGDNPLCPPWFIEELIDSWKNDPRSQVVTPYVQLSWEELDALRKAKEVTPFSGTSVMVDKDEHALCFSKCILPAIRKEEKVRTNQSLSPVKRHIGLYAYTYPALEEYFSLSRSPYEDFEGLEQMRFLHNNIKVKMVQVDYRGFAPMSGVDSPEDIERVETIIKKIGELPL
ncbi:3-deoxy-manno-octulosonate cytidylyltransferase [Maridesulfovibrio bastinii]|uniref:3-deoxy-manno-octulosonate cytidylyltransferase n=1 Tax=Maridesulfovibrio bastinii TaxID=47157 RepID=UPI0004187F46|nr:3-deoxy-manno-octulosonate cytidylyltransferase [Maridesulfovibrio bastinii]